MTFKREEETLQTAASIHFVGKIINHAICQILSGRGLESFRMKGGCKSSAPPVRYELMDVRGMTAGELPVMLERRGGVISE